MPPSRRRRPPQPLHDRAVQAGRRMVARGERPLYRVRVTAGGVGGMLEARCVDLPLVAVLARSRVDVVQRAREAIAVELDVPADGFDVVVDEAR